MTDAPGAWARGRASVVGVGQTPLSKAAPDSVLELALDACLEALADAGISASEVDGLLRFGAPFETVSHGELVANLGIRDLGYFGEIPLGGEASAGMLHHAVGALVSGRASVVLAYRAIKQSGGNRFGRADQALHGGPPADEDVRVGGGAAFTWPYWMMAPAHLFALWASRYLDEADITEAQFRHAVGRVAMDQREYASHRPGALLHDRPLDAEQFDAARMISWPLTLFMLCLENDGACAVVVTTTERATSLGAGAVPILATCQSMAPRREPGSMYGDDLLEIVPPSRVERLWAEAGVGPHDVSVAELYDASSLMTLLSLEQYGFVGHRKAWQHVTEHGIGLDSPLPVNTHGGHLADGYVHGMTGVIEAVRQVRGTATNQVPGASVSFFGGVSGSATVFANPEITARVTEELSRPWK
ncbi:MAG: thiolase C-terminal domain-containing protein [Acidimicrobiales bacterium]